MDKEINKTEVNVMLVEIIFGFIIGIILSTLIVLTLKDFGIKVTSSFSALIGMLTGMLSISYCCFIARH
jgi:uncharacterized protein YacL